MRMLALLLLVPALLSAAEPDPGLLVFSPPEGWTSQGTMGSRTRAWRSPVALKTPQATADEATLRAWTTANHAAGSISIAWEPLGRGTELAGWVATARDRFLDLAPDCTVLDEGPIALGGRTAWRIDLQFTLGTLPWRQTWWLVITEHGEDPQRGHCVVASTGADTWAEWAPVFEQAVATIRLPE